VNDASSSVPGNADQAAREQSESQDDSKSAAARMVDTLLQTVAFDIALLMILGVPIWLLRRNQALSDRLDVEATQPQQTVQTSVTSAADAGAADRDPWAVLTTSGTEPVPRSRRTDSDGTESWRFMIELQYAAEASLAAWLPTAALRIIMVLLFQDDAQHPFLEMIDQDVTVQVLLLIVVTAVVLAPLMEELLYRVVILGGLLHGSDGQNGVSLFAAITVSSLLFAFAHGFPDSLALLPLAVALAWIYIQRRSYWTVILVHVLFNGFNILVAGLGML